MPRYTVTIARWDVYRVFNVEADTASEAEERGLESGNYEHMDGGVHYVDAVETEKP